MRQGADLPDQKAAQALRLGRKLFAGGAKALVAEHLFGQECLLRNLVQGIQDLFEIDAITEDYRDAVQRICNYFRRNITASRVLLISSATR